MASILTSIKHDLGIDEEYTHFDPGIIAFINTALFILHQLGVGPKTPFRIKDKTSTWEEFLDKQEDQEGVQEFVYLKVKLVFDPPQMGYLVQAIKDQIKELEWRLNSQVEGDQL